MTTLVTWGTCCDQRRLSCGVAKLLDDAASPLRSCGGEAASAYTEQGWHVHAAVPHFEHECVGAEPVTLGNERNQILLVHCVGVAALLPRRRRQHQEALHMQRKARRGTNGITFRSENEGTRG